MPVEIPIFHTGVDDYVGLIQPEIPTHGQSLSDYQRETLYCIADTIIPCVSGVDGCGTTDGVDLRKYYALKPSQNTDFADKLLLVVNNPRFIPVQAANDLILALNQLGNRVSTFQLTGYMSSFNNLTGLQRERAWFSLLTSRIYMKRKLAHSLRCLIGITYFACLDSTGKNMLWEYIDYKLPENTLFPDVRLPKQFPSKILKELHDKKSSMKQLVEKLQPGLSAYLNPDVTHASRISQSCDVVIIGSGSGGGVVAEYLEKGLRVLVLEQGGFYPNSLNHGAELTDERAFKHKYEGGGFLQTSDGSMAILAGRTVGGGSAINWGCCLPPPLKLRETWARLGLPLFLTNAYSECISDIEKSMSIHKYSERNHNGSNSLLLAGARKAGLQGASTGQNSDASHDCGTCCFGCSTGLKQGTHVNSLPKSEATVIPNCRVDKICTRIVHGSSTFTNVCVNDVHVDQTSLDGPIEHSYDKQVTGVEGTVHIFNGIQVESLKFEISAKIVVLSAGSLHSPLLLRRSNIDNEHIGAHLKLHPVCGVVAEFETPALEAAMQEFGPDRLARTNQKKVQTWEGNPMTSVVCMNEDEQGHSSRVEIPCIHPGQAAFAVKWGMGANNATELTHGKEFKRVMQNLGNLVPTIVLTRDLGEGTVDGWEEPIVNYTMHAYDKQSMLLGIQQTCKMLLAAGATVLHAPQVTIAPYFPNNGTGLADPKFQDFQNQIATQNIVEGQMGIFSAHQMGSCRMGRSEIQGVVNPAGEVYNVNNLFIADASVFPSSSGVNPMVTTMATARMITAFINQRAREQ